jgi:glycosyltransferase involved in cell wall biosynthesis
VRDRDPAFELVVLGGGPDLADLERRAADLPWLHVLGPTFGDEKVLAFAAARLFLLPGLVGLAVLDSFALQTPMVTIDVPYHGPEIAYLDADVNGVVLPADTSPQAYAAAVVALFEDEARWQRLVAGCREAANRYTIADMAARFADGVSRALRTPPYRGR